MEDIRFDDIGKLKTKISDAFGEWSEAVEVSQEMINRFAELTGDHQWIHVDVERAGRESPFGGTVAHGYLTLSLLAPTAFETFASQVETKAALNYGLDKVRFLAPVRAGRRVRNHVKLVAVVGKVPGR